MKVGIMQSYLFPHLGYFQLISSVDKFIVDENVKWINRGWINRNRILFNGQPKIITLSVKKNSSHNKINNFCISKHDNNRKTFLNKIHSAYNSSPEFTKVFKLISNIVLYKEDNLSKLIYYSLRSISDYLNIKTTLSVLSKLTIDRNPDLKGKERVLNMCKQLKATTYINSIGGISLYDKNEFNNNNINLLFLKTRNAKYNQRITQFVPNLSIIDVLMFNSKSEAINLLNEYDLI